MGKQIVTFGDTEIEIEITAIKSYFSYKMSILTKY